MGDGARSANLNRSTTDGVTPEQRRQYRAIGAQLAVHVRQQQGGAPSVVMLRALTTDLAAGQSQLVLPLRELVSLPGFAALLAKAGSGGGAVESQALLQTLAEIFLEPLIAALAEVLAGFLEPIDSTDPKSQVAAWGTGELASASSLNCDALGVCEAHQAGVRSVSFSPNGMCIVSASDDKTLRLWDAKTGNPIGSPLQGHTESVRSVAFSPDGRRIVSGSWDTTIRLWDANTCQTINTPFRVHSKGVLSVAFSPNGERLISGSADNTLRIWDACTSLPSELIF